jgi:protein-tyrosine-phosphatase
MTEMSQRKPINVLFMGRTNSTRSIMAEAILNHDGQGRFQAFSAGIEPASEVHPYAIELLSRLGFDVNGLAPKSCLNFASPEAVSLDFVFSVCDSAPDTADRTRWPGNPLTGQWGVPDPAAARGKDAEIRLAFADTFRMLNQRIAMLTNLPIRLLDRLSPRLGLSANRDAVKAPAAA